MDKLTPANMTGRLCLLLLCGLPCQLQAHRLDECLQAAMLIIEPTRVHLQLTIEPGTDVAATLLHRIDRDNNQQISSKEAANYVSELQRELSLRIDDQPLTWRLEKSRFDTPMELRSGSGHVQLQLSAASPRLQPGSHRLSFENRHLPAISVYLFNAIQPDSLKVKIARQQRNDTQSTGMIEFNLER